MGMVSLRGNRTEVSKFSVSLVPLVLWFLDDQHKAYKKALLLFFSRFLQVTALPFLELIFVDQTVLALNSHSSSAACLCPLISRLPLSPEYRTEENPIGLPSSCGEGAFTPSPPPSTFSGLLTILRC